MPDHVHVLLAPNDCRATVSEIVQAFKSLSTRVVKQTGVIGRVWKRGFHDRVVRILGALHQFAATCAIVFFTSRRYARMLVSRCSTGVSSSLQCDNPFDE